MKNLKMLTAALMIAMLSIVTGCSDQITSSGETGSSKKDEEVKQERKIFQDPKDALVLIEKSFALKPGGSFKFNLQTTGLERLYSVALFNDDASTQDVDVCRLVSVYGDVDNGSIGCNSSGFAVKEITVLNTSKSILFLKANLKGIKQKIIKSEITQVSE